MREELRYASFLLATIAATTSCVKESPTKRPNVLFILADDLGYGDTGCYGADKIKTPNIDRLATQGRRFTDAHSASAVSTPSRYSLLTGEYPFRAQDPASETKGLYRPMLGNQIPLIIDVNDLSFPEMMQRQGYNTACIGKWHLGFGNDEIDWNGSLIPGPNEVGFDYYFGVPLVNSHPPFFYVENHKVVGYDPNDPIYYLSENAEERATPTQLYDEKFQNMYSGGKVAHSLYKDDEGAETLLQKAIDWLDKTKDQSDPFFLYFASTHIHHPFTPSDRFKGSSECGIYGDYAQELDWMIGELLTYLDDNKLSDNTIVVVTSDNGAMLNRGGQNAWTLDHKINGDLLGYKFGSWEGGHRIPFIVRWPGMVEPGSVSDCLICNVDMMATFAAITGYELQVGDAPDSYNVLDSWIGGESETSRDHFVISPFSPRHVSLRDGEWVYIPTQGAGGFAAKQWGAHALGSEGALKYTGQVNSDIVDGAIREGAPQAQLYNIIDDPYQTTNVIESNRDIADMLSSKLKTIIDGEHTREY